MFNYSLLVDVIIMLGAQARRFLSLNLRTVLKSQL